ncbi:hypothetical protein [Sphingomonas adhaesiva]|uniref:hypothetical protein n=1 Tax=Sphingomonas adhaesiva TaxID=28212 RepID=UPI002FFD0747
MATRTIFRLLAVLLASLLYWTLVSHVANVAEPWDAPAYWRGWYPGALLLSAVGGRLIGWSAGAIVIAAQAPVMAINGALAADGWPIALPFLLALAVPAVAVAALARISRRSL